jgi:phosphate-selective porin OprO and OprP
MGTKIATAAILAMGMGALATSHAAAESAGNDGEIAALKHQLHLLEQKLDRLEKQSAATAKATAAKTKAETAVTSANAKAIPATAVAAGNGAVTSSEAVVTMPNNRPTICTVDQQNCISLTGRVHFDGGGYDYHPNSPSTVPQRLDDGVNVRRARIGVTGKFLGDWNYTLIYDFGGSSDGFGGTGSAGGVPVGFLPGGAVSGLENAYLSYTGFKPFGGTLAIEGGVMDLPWTLDEAMSSNDVPFMERASPGVVARFAADDFRSAFGARWFNDVFWAGGYVTGPTTGSIHSASSVNPPGTTEQLGAVARVAGQAISGKDYSLHLGADAEFLIKPPHNLVASTQTLTLSDRPELRIDPTTLISTGAIANVSDAQVYGLEAAGTYGPLFFQGEYYWFNVNRNAATGLPPFGAPSLKFEGGYAEAALVLTGETRKYNPAAASYLGVVPERPFSPAGGGWGAWEIAGRVSTINLNDQLGTSTGIAGGRQTVYTAGLNWYVSRNVRFLFDYLHGNVVKQISPTNPGDAGAKFDAYAMRTQIAF